MKNWFLGILIVTVFSVSAQDKIPENEAVQKVITTFFEGFHKRDSLLMRSTFHEKATVQTIGKSRTGDVVLVEEDLGEVLSGIASIPDSIAFQEVIHDYRIRIDGPMANVWTPYSFFMNDRFSHCGVNNFQLLKVGQEWEVIYLIDTRRRKACKEAAEQ